MLNKNRLPRIVVVTRKTRMENLRQRWATRGQMNFMFRQNKAHVAMKRRDMDVDAIMAEPEDDLISEFTEEFDTYHDAVKDIQSELDLGYPVQVIDREYLATVGFDMCAVVVVVGQDGLVANTAKYVGDVPIIGVNPDPDRIDGVLLPWRPADVRQVVQRVIRGNYQVREVTLAEVQMHDEQRLLAFNDFYIGSRTHVSARYELTVGGRSEEQSSSGILVSTGAGSTGWISSVLNMTRGVCQYLNTNVGPEKSLQMDWDAHRLLWVVREPFRSQTTGIELVCGELSGVEEMMIESQMDSGGVIFSDGIEADYLDFNGGAIARIGIADQRARLVVG
ncbi:MAG: NAD(+)/NADH kinase [Planctomycetaceae bacterium]|nr:NAD(+)/NADH kinase [Planctomycetaceae bacterium]